MKESQFEYKCRRCGKVSLNPCCNVDLAVGLLHCATLQARIGDVILAGDGVQVVERKLEGLQ